MRNSRAPVCFGAALVLAAAAACASAGPGGGAAERAAAPADAQAAVVVRVVDGDTLVLRGRGGGPLPGEDTRVRLLEVDAPESVTPDRPVGCFGPQAASALRDLAPPGATLAVTADREPADRFGRALLYAWTKDGVFVNEALVRGGHAESLLVGENDRYIVRLREAEEAAREEGAGLWGACPGPPDAPGAPRYSAAP